MRQSGRGRVVVLSDLHVGQGDAADIFDADDALAAMLDGVAGDPAVGQLVLLGDVLDLAPPGPTRRSSAEVASERLAAAWQAHPDVLAGLRAVLRAGKQVTVVRGNHDVALAMPAVADALRRSLDPAEGRLGLAAWLWQVPGQVLAEHGHQHHDINALDTVLSPFSGRRGRDIQRPFGARLDGLLHSPRRRPAVALGVAAAAGSEALRLVAPRRHRSRARYRHDELPRYAAEIGLSPEAVVALDRLTEVAPHRVVVRLAGELRGAGSTGGYLPRAAGRMADVLGRQAPALLVFGHTHAADVRALRPGTTYLNAGTWSSRGPRAGTSSLGAPRRTWLELSLGEDGARPSARVLRWSPTGSAEPLAEVDPTGRVLRTDAV